MNTYSIIGNNFIAIILVIAFILISNYFKNKEQTKELPSLNGLRALSIFFVVFHHLGQKNFFIGLNDYFILRLFSSFLQDGQLGVNIFFVISGFLITTLLIKEEQTNNKINLKNFYIRRSLRIFPAFYFLLLVYFILQLLGHLYFTNLSWFTSLTYLKYFNRGSDLLSGHFWSLSVEEHYYMFWPVIFIAGLKLRRNVLLALIITVILIKSITFYYPISWINDLNIFTRIDAIAIGCLFAIYKYEIINIIGNKWNYVFLVSSICIFVLHFIPNKFLITQPVFIFHVLGSAHGTIANFFIGLLILFSIYGTKGLWYKFLNFKILNHIGNLSYSIYLWQQIVIYNPFGYKLNPIEILFVIYILAITSFYIIEKPFLKLKVKFIK